MRDKPWDRIFISYSRKDGAECAAKLRKWLLNENLSVWQDIVALEGGRDWWSQIEDALKTKSLQHFVLIVTPAALASPVVCREIRLARQEGKTVCPIKGPGLGEQLPRWLGQIYDLDLPEHRTTLIRVLQDQSREKRVVMMAPEPPADYVQRPAEFDALKKQLLDTKGDAVAITAALRGAGGYGKTTLAKALAHDLDIQDAFFDGTLWVELGEKPENLLLIISDLVTRLTGAQPGLNTIPAAGSALGEALGDRRILLIVDDVWREQDLRPFMQGGSSTTRLVTTRNDSTLPANAVRQRVDAMRYSEALSLIAAGLPAGQVLTQQRELTALTGRLGQWPLLLKLVNGFLNRAVERGQALPSAITGVNHRLDRKGLAAFDARNEIDRAKAVALTIGVSLEALDDASRDRFAELGIFPEGAHIPIGIVERLWSNHLDETEDLLNELYSLSLLLGLDLDRRTLQMHDTIRRFLGDQTTKEELSAQHKRLLAVLDEIGGSGQADVLTRRYYYLHLLYHLAGANERERLDGLLLDPKWLKTKLAATGNTAALIADYNQYAVGEAQNTIGRTLRLMAGICARDQRQLIPQLLARLMTNKAIIAAGFLGAARQSIVAPAILEQHSSLAPSGAEIARLEGHSGAVTALCVLPDGRLASGSWDNTIRLWDPKTGAETARLEGHSGAVAALCLLPDGCLASCSGGGFGSSDDNTIRLWDPTTGAETARLEVHSSDVRALCLLPDGRLASGDETIRPWDPTTGAKTVRLEGHSHYVVAALCPLRDGRLASGSYDGTIRLWDPTTGAETARLEGHSGPVEALCLLPEGHLASGSYDGTIRLWDPTTGAETARLEGHSGGVTALCLLSDGRLASGSWDKTIRLWDLAKRAETARLEGHSGGVTALCLLPDGSLASGSADGTIRLWDPVTSAEIARLEGHSGPVTALCLLPDGRLASVSADRTIRLWDLAKRAETARLEGHSDAVTALCLLPDGRLASASADRTIRLWDPTSGAESARLEAEGAVACLTTLPGLHLAAGDSLGRLHWLEVLT